ncbi:MAG: hypothetical protein ACTH2Q_16110 [Propionibacteriaceae bacterium]
MLTGLGVATGMLVASAPAEAAPVEPVEMANLPWNADLDWAEPGAFVADGQWTGPGPDEATYCLRGDPGEELGAQRVFQRSYDLPGSDSGHAQALIMEFESNDVADEAYGTLATWATECKATLLDKGYVQTGAAEGHRVSHPGTEARFTELRYLMQDGGDSEDARSESLGAVRDQNKVALVSMNVLDEREPDWAHAGDGSGKSLHPMYSSLPKAADRLVG